MTAAAVVKRARSLVGAAFRPQGRDPATGLDCVGLVLASYAIDGAEVRRDYRLRGDHIAELQRRIERFFRRLDGKEEAGDLLLCRIADDQLHLAISCGDSFIHADASLRKIVETPGAPLWPVETIYRRRRRASRKH